MRFQAGNRHASHYAQMLAILLVKQIPGLLKKVLADRALFPAAQVGEFLQLRLLRRVETASHYAQMLAILLVKQIPGLLKKVLADRALFPAAQVGEFLQLRLLRRVEMYRHFNIDPDMEVAEAVALNILDALAFETKQGPRLGAWR